MATVFRPPLISPQRNTRAWTADVHSQGANSVPRSILNIAGQTPRIRQYDWPAPPNRPYDLLLRTWTWRNSSTQPPVLRTPHQFTELNAPANRPYDLGLRTWTWSTNPLLRPPAPVKPPQRFDYPVPPERPYGPQLRTWTNQNPSIYNALGFPPGWKTDQTAPKERPYAIERTWIGRDMSHYPPPSVRPPQQAFDLSVPLPRPYGLDGTWISTGTVRLTPVAPSQGEQTKIFIGEIQQMGLTTILDSSMGLT